MLCPVPRTLMLAFALVWVSACCPQADCPNHVHFNVRDALTGEAVQDLEVTPDAGEVVCRVAGERTWCSGHGDGLAVVHITVTAPGYAPVELRGDFDDADDVCPGCPMYDLSSDDVDVGQSVALSPLD